MPNGYGTAPEELRFVAGRIGEVASLVASAVWQGPSGDYGHPGVQACWAGFIEEMQRHVHGLRDKADGHGQGLVAAATSYLDNEFNVGDLIGKAGAMLGSGDPAPGSEMPTGFFHPSIAQRLDGDGS